MNDIFSYTNYRKFIQDFYNNEKKAKKHFSYQFFARRAGFSSRENLFKVVKGQISLPKKKIFDMAYAMCLNDRQTAYFEALVNFNEAKTIKEREYYFEKIRAVSKKTPVYKLMDGQYEFYSKWYNLVIRELVTFLDFRDDFQVLAAALLLMECSDGGGPVAGGSVVTPQRGGVTEQAGDPILKAVLGASVGVHKSVHKFVIPGVF